MMFMLARQRPVRFVIAERYAASGSTVMRGEQLAAIATASLPGRRAIGVAPHDADFRRSDLFLTKGVLKVIGPEQIVRWRRAGNRVFLDPVDEAVPEAFADVADVVVAASRTARDDYRERWPSARIELVDHHVDPRVVKAVEGRTPPAALSVAYFGETLNARLPASATDRVDVVHVDTSSRDTVWIDRLAHYNCHYAVRQARGLDEHKPFLKGFTAAASSSPVIIQRGQLEAERWLPPDYPFWVGAAASDSDIDDGLNRVADAFGGPVWADALAAMAGLAAETAPAAVGRQLERLFV